MGGGMRGGKGRRIYEGREGGGERYDGRGGVVVVVVG